MNSGPPSSINIAIVGGDEVCRELLKRAHDKDQRQDIGAPILAVAEPDPTRPGRQLAEQLGLLVFDDYHSLYSSEYHIDLIILLTPEPQVFNDILNTRPPHIRILSHNVFNLFWNIIGREERQLREQKKAMETIINGIQDFILLISPNLEILEANESFLKKMGYTLEEVVGRKCNEIFPHCDNVCGEKLINCPLTDVIKNKRPVGRLRTHTRKTGEKKYYEITVYPIWEKSGKIQKFIHISHDITQRKREEEEITQQLEQMVMERTRELKEIHAKLLHQDKMASLGKLAASVVHEINNPMAGILNLTLLVRRILEEDEPSQLNIRKIQDYLKLMETETRRTSRIVSNLLAFSRQSKMELTRLNLNRIIEKTLLINVNLLKLGRVKVEKRLDSALPDIIGSEDQLQQVFMNFISNAVEAMEFLDSGTLFIETRSGKNGKSVEALFRDTGIGIEKENMSRLFEPFYTTKKKGKGVGLGLSVVYGIIQDHGGVIEVRSKSGKGTTFSVTLPFEGPKTLKDTPELVPLKNTQLSQGMERSP
ncbi:MAG: ATP-binding protein [Desulfobacterales bacterium]|jgi:PAS domain S-box-containing protein|nr:ATP-binding protein [Desulfobacterales bacterium]